MQDFRFSTADDVVGDWSAGRLPYLDSEEGSNFFVASWSVGTSRLFWVGIYHPVLDDLEFAARQLAHSSTNWAIGPGISHHLLALCDHTPGWFFGFGRAEKCCVWRDPIGRLPLFWARKRFGVEWATRPRQLSAFSDKIRRSRLKKFLERSKDFARDEFYQGVQRIRAGEYLVGNPRHSPRLFPWWPDVPKPVSDGEDLARRTAEIVGEALNRSCPTSDCLVSLSGGVDSPTLATLAARGRFSTRSISMVAEGTDVFDERSEIETILEALQISGRFVDIGGSLDWNRPEIHHFCPGFGPSAYSQAAYYRYFLKKVIEESGGRDRAVLVSGLGADQLFGCRRNHYLVDRWIHDRDLDALIHGFNWKRLIKRGTKLLGIDGLPVPDRRTSPPWMDVDRQNQLPDFYWSHAFDLKRWTEKRTDQFRSWLWEHSIRLLERQRRATGVLFVLPFLDPSVVEFGLSLRPRHLCTEQVSKWPLRQLLRPIVGDGIALRSKHGVFDEVVWQGLTQYFDPPLDVLLGENARIQQLPYLAVARVGEKLRSIEQQNRCVGIRHGHDLWRIIASELWLREHGDGGFDK